MPRALKLGRTGNKHVRKKKKVVADELEDHDTEKYAPCEMKFDEVDIEEVVKSVLYHLVDQVRSEHKVAWSDAMYQLLEAASDMNGIQFAVRSLRLALQATSLCEAYRRWRYCVRRILAASPGRRLRADQQLVGAGWCMLWGAHCYCRREPCPDCDMPTLPPFFASGVCHMIWTPGECECRDLCGSSGDSGLPAVLPWDYFRAR